MPLRNLLILPAWILVTVFSTATAYAQTKKIDSLKLLLVKAREDTNKFRLYYNVAGEYWLGLADTIDFENTFKYEDSAISLARKLNYQYGIFDALMCYGNVYVFQNRLPESRKSYSDAIGIAKKILDKNNLAETYFEIAGNYFMYGNDAKKNIVNFPISLDYYFKALKVFEESGNKYKMAVTWLRIGRTYAWQNFFNMGYGNVDEIEKCADNAMRLYKECKETTKEDMATINFFCGRAHYFKNRYANALEFFYKALEFDKTSTDKYTLANTYLNIGRSYKGLGDSSTARSNKALANGMYKKAMANFNTSLDIYRSPYTAPSSFNNAAFKGLCHLYIGTVKTNLGQFTEARENLDSAINYTDKLNGGGTYQEIYQSLAKLDSAEGNYKLALAHYNKYMAYKDSSFNAKSLLESQAYKLQFEFDKKEDSLKQTQLITETNLKVEKKQKYFYWIGLAMLALLSFFVFLSFRNQKKINRLAAETHAKEKAQLELQTLRAQLNPHFIFNCISSIDGLIQNNEKYDATNYLNKFAKLMRNVLEDSKEDSVTFSNDIETLKLYLDLEQLRNEDKYSTQLIVPEELLNSNYIVPPLVIQPFVENAIKHGLKNKPGKNGLLKIEVKQVEDHLQYIISDNGIGRQATSHQPQDNKSYGLQISADRIKLFNKEEAPSVSIKDEIENGIAVGTTVTVKLKFR